MVKTNGIFCIKFSLNFCSPLFPCFSACFPSVEHCVASLLARETVQELGLSVPVWLPGGDIDHTDVQEVDHGRHHHQTEGEPEGGSAFAGPLSLHPEPVDQKVVFHLEIVLNYPGNEGRTGGK